jgi:hypothetical protein
MSLYCGYYQPTQHSDGGVVSSHWGKYGSLTNVIKKEKYYILSGVGFGNFIPSNSLKALKHLFPNVRSKFLLNKFQVDSKIKLAGFDVARKSGRAIDFDCVKQILSMDLLCKHNILNRVKTAVVIGDGYGYMTALLRTLLPEATIICVNLGRILFFDVYYLGKILPNENCCLNSTQDNHSRLIFWEAENYQALDSLSVDLFINIASMQEMNTSVIGNYFKIMRSGKGERYFYCCNRLEKTLPDGSVIRFDAYPWDRNDEVFLDELCPWYQKFPILQPPFWKSFDGPIQHRFVKLCKQAVA